MRLDERINHINNAEHRKPVAGYDETYNYYKANGGWVIFINNSLPKGKRPCGWKFHISIENASLNQVWHDLEPYLFSEGNGILSCKVVNQQKLPNTSGKQIVLYTFNDPMCKPMQPTPQIFNLLLKIESVLRLHQVKPGIQPKSSLKVSGSRYLSIRNDMNRETNQYIPNDIAVKVNEDYPYNPYGYDNPYKNFNLCHLRERFFSPRTKVLSIKKNFYSYSPEEPHLAGLLQNSITPC